MSTASTPGRDAQPRLGNYEQERGSFAIEVPERFNPVLDIVERWAGEAPEELAVLSLTGAGEQLASQSVAELARESRRAARALLALGVGKGDRVFVMLPRIPAWYTVMLGAMRIGAVPMPAPNQLTPRDMAYRIEQGEAVMAFTDLSGAEKFAAIDSKLVRGCRLVCFSDGELAPAGADSLEELLDAAGDGETPQDPTSREDPLLLFFTSGTVSYPKMVVHRTSYALGHIGTARFWHDLRRGDLHWTVTDTGWAKAAWGGLFGQWHERASVVQVDLGKPDADGVLGLISRNGITSFCAPPTLYRLLVQSDLKAHDLSCLRHCTSAGEPLNPEVLRAWAEGTGGLTVYDGYGQTETTCLVANYRAVPVRPGSMGKPVPGYEVEVVDEQGRATATGEVGDVAVRTDPHPVGLFHGYHNDSQATASRFRHGWYYTGDRARRDADGYLWFEGRDDDIITSSAYRIGPFEVESALIEHPAVMEAGVVGKPDPLRTEIVCAFVILAEGYAPSAELSKELSDHARRLTAPYKHPREIHYVAELPKTVSGKIRRTELRDWLSSEVPEQARWRSAR